MQSCLYNKDTNLTLSEWNILEPKICYAIDNITIDVVFVPLLICDKSGNRVGYGKGFYDKFLSQCKQEIIVIGLNYFEPIEKIIDSTDKDFPLNYLVTPNQIYSF